MTNVNRTLPGEINYICLGKKIKVCDEGVWYVHIYMLRQGLILLSADCLEKVEASASQNPMDLHDLLRG
jgi:hypothetical protein